MGIADNRGTDCGRRRLYDLLACRAKRERFYRRPGRDRNVDAARGDRGRKQRKGAFMGSGPKVSSFDLGKRRLKVFALAYRADEGGCKCGPRLIGAEIRRIADRIEQVFRGGGVLSTGGKKIDAATGKVSREGMDSKVR